MKHFLKGLFLRIYNFPFLFMSDIYNRQKVQEDLLLAQEDEGDDEDE